MEKIPIDNIYSMFPKISKDVIQIIYEQDKENILDILLELSESCDTDNKNKSCNIQNEGNINDNEESDSFQNNSKTNKFFNFFLKKTKHKYEKL